MNITQVYLTLANKNNDPRELIVKYQNQTTYIQLFLEECLRKIKVNLGPFNRLVFEEGGIPSEDFLVVGNNAMGITVADSYQHLTDLHNDELMHKYFIQQFLDGFYRFDCHFSTSLKEILEPLVLEKYKRGLFYEKKLATKKNGSQRFQIIGRYSRTLFTLELKEFKGRMEINSQIIYTCEPDLFHVKFHIHKLNFYEKVLSITNKIDEETLKINIPTVGQNAKK